MFSPQHLKWMGSTQNPCLSTPIWQNLCLHGGDRLNVCIYPDYYLWGSGRNVSVGSFFFFGIYQVLSLTVTRLRAELGPLVHELYYTTPVR